MAPEKLVYHFCRDEERKHCLSVVYSLVAFRISVEPAASSGSQPSSELGFDQRIVMILITNLESGVRPAREYTIMVRIIDGACVSEVGPP